MIDLRQGDSRIILADVVPDVLLCDPPYSQHVHENTTSCGTPGARASGAMKGAAHRDLGFEHLGDELMAWTCALAARTRRWSVIFTDTESVGAWRAGLNAAGAKYIRAIPWIRWSMPNLAGLPPQGHEMIVLAWGAGKGRKSWNGPGNLTHFNQTCMRGKNKHSAQKPLDLVLDLVEFFSNPVGEILHSGFGPCPGATPGELVCDPFMGSGTTAMACAALGRNFVGCEQSGAWYDNARTRLEGSAAMYDDEERFAKYEAASKARQADMIRMAANTARIVANRAAAEAAAVERANHAGLQPGETTVFDDLLAAGEALNDEGEVME